MAASSPQTTYLAFANVGPGLEELLSGELAELGLGPGRTLAGGVEVRVSLAGLHILCSRSRLAEGVRVRLKSFEARTFAELERGLSRLPWRAYFPPSVRVRIDVVCHKSRLWHSDAVAERVRRVLTERAEASPEPPADSDEEGARRLFVRLQDDTVTVSVDASGERLHRRGYRKHVAEASLRETLAAAMIRAFLPNLEAGAVLWDPFCGAGTIPLEALARAHGIVFERRFAFQSWPALSAHLLAESFSAADGAPVCDIRVIGSDRDPRAIDAARANLTLLGLPTPDCAEFRLGDLLGVAPSIPRGALILTNPPYGQRLDEGQGIESLLRVVRERPDLRPVGALVGGTAKRILPSEFQTLFQTQNGGLNVALRALRGEALSRY